MTSMAVVIIVSAARGVARGHVPPVVDWVDFYGKMALLGRMTCFIQESNTYSVYQKCSVGLKYAKKDGGDLKF